MPAVDPRPNFNNKTCLITGASAGLGRDFAELFARDGYRCILVARRRDILNSIAQSLNTKYLCECIVIDADLAIPGAGSALFDKINELGLNVDVLVNNAGAGTYGMFIDSNETDQLKMIDLNIRVLTELTRCIAPQMVARGEGRILNVASTAAFQPGPLMAVYYATKAYVLSFSEALSNELAGTGVTVTILCPGPTETEFQQLANIDISKLKKSGWLMPSMRAATAGYRGMLRGKRIVIPGFINFIIAESVRFAPRSFVLRTARWIQEQGRSAAKPAK
ncbi:MAG: SDR family NAD(P)-dependent oxidoreductase [Planctomycetota bacterium]